MTTSPNRGRKPSARRGPIPIATERIYAKSMGAIGDAAASGKARAAVLAAGVRGAIARRRRPQAPVPTEPRLDAPAPSQPDQLPASPQAHIAVVVNPTKVGNLTAERDRLARLSTEAGLGAPLIYETTLADPGPGQTQRALLNRPKGVIAYGGDGTVRQVASQLAGTSTPLGIIPAGTGNLLARNLCLPLSNRTQTAQIALDGQPKPIDMGMVQIDVSGEDHDPRNELFTVMAGIGFDAEVMAGVTPQLKARISWAAYVVSGVKAVRKRRTWVTIKVDDEPAIYRQVRSVVIGNCGDLVGGLPLMPGAVIDDGKFDVAVVSPLGWIGWGAVVALVLSRTRRPNTIVHHFQCRTIEVLAVRPMHVQVDGDPLGTARGLRACLVPLALNVRVPT